MYILITTLTLNLQAAAETLHNHGKAVFFHAPARNMPHTLWPEYTIDTQHTLQILISHLSPLKVEQHARDL